MLNHLRRSVSHSGAVPEAADAQRTFTLDATPLDISFVHPREQRKGDDDERHAERKEPSPRSDRKYGGADQRPDRSRERQHRAVQAIDPPKLLRRRMGA